MSDSETCKNGPGGIHTGPDGIHTGPDFVTASNGSAPTVLPTPSYAVNGLKEDDLRKLNHIQLSYAHTVAQAQANAYKGLLALLGDSKA